MAENAHVENYSKVVAKAWTDKAYKAKLKSDPKAALKELGMDVPAGVSINVVEDDAKTVTLVLPAPPKEGDISVEELTSISGGTLTTICIIVCA